MTEAEEQELVSAIKSGREAEMVSRRSPRLDPHAKVRLRRLISAGRLAQERLISENLHLVEKVADRFTTTESSRDDLRSEGLIGLHRATEKFDSNFGVRFYQYAWYWVYQAISRAAPPIEQVIKLPIEVQTALSEVRKIETYLHARGVNDVDPQVLAEACGMSLATLLDLYAYARMKTLASTDDPHLSPAIKNIPEEVKERPESEERDLRDAVQAILGNLHDSERLVIEHRFGLNGERPQTLYEVASALNVTPEIVRQIEQKVLARMRHPDNSGRLRGFLDE